MIITKLFGGLGNQLFQYAVGRSLSERIGTDLKLDISEFNKQNKREYALSIYKINSYIASDTEINFALKKRPLIIDRVLSKLRIKKNEKYLYVREKSLDYSSRILDLSGNIYLDGYWQSEKYFLDIRQILLSELIPKVPQSDNNLCLAENIIASDSVSIHVRRSDYVNDETIRKVHGVCPISYYFDAMRYVNQIVKNPYYYIFTDDPEWVKQHLLLDDTMVLVKDNLNQPHVDMKLMSLCKHNIIANSSFSWWGAWLNENKNKIVIAPREWFKVTSKNTKDLIPDAWIKV